MLNPDRRRITFQQVELGLSEAAARDEARRCLRCDICKRCGRCMAICRDKMGVDALQFGYLDIDQPGLADFRVTAERCILCGACAANCPTGAIALTDRDGERTLSFCGTILCREKLETCDSCGAAVGPARYVEYVRKRIRSVGNPFAGRLLCADCVRRATAASKSGVLPPERTRGW